MTKVGTGKLHGATQHPFHLVSCVDWSRTTKVVVTDPCNLKLNVMGKKLYFL